jgi:hypothetical protein
MSAIWIGFDDQPLDLHALRTRIHTGERTTQRHQDAVSHISPDPKPVAHALADTIVHGSRPTRLPWMRPLLLSMSPRSRQEAPRFGLHYRIEQTRSVAHLHSYCQPTWHCPQRSRPIGPLSRIGHGVGTLNGPHIPARIRARVPTSGDGGLGAPYTQCPCPLCGLDRCSHRGSVSRTTEWHDPLRRTGLQRAVGAYRHRRHRLPLPWRRQLSQRALGASS